MAKWVTTALAFVLVVEGGLAEAGAKTFPSLEAIQTSNAIGMSLECEFKILIGDQTKVDEIVTEAPLVAALAPAGLFLLDDEQTTCTPAAQCCKICTTGKACGNSCISANYTCHKGRGCACNSYEVCKNH
jgi:hypothetical protein